MSTIRNKMNKQPVFNICYDPQIKLIAVALIFFIRETNTEYCLYTKASLPGYLAIAFTFYPKDKQFSHVLTENTYSYLSKRLLF